MICSQMKEKDKYKIDHLFFITITQNTLLFVSRIYLQLSSLSINYLLNQIHEFMFCWIFDHSSFINNTSKHYNLMIYTSLFHFTSSSKICQLIVTSHFSENFQLKYHCCYNLFSCLLQFVLFKRKKIT